MFGIKGNEVFCEPTPEGGSIATTILALFAASAHWIMSQAKVEVLTVTSMPPQRSDDI